MSYNADDHFPEIDRVFAPCLYQPETLAFIREHLGENPQVALRDLSPEDLNIHRHNFRDIWGGKNGRDVVDSADAQYQRAFQTEVDIIRNALRRFYDLQDLEKSNGGSWVGVEAVGQAIEIWEERQRRFRDRKHSNPGKTGYHPEMYVHERGQRYYQKPGSDVGRPRRYDLDLIDIGKFDASDFTSDLKEKPSNGNGDDVPGELRKGEDWIGCPICSYQVQFNPESNEDYNRNVHRVKQHMRAVKKDEDLHQIALAKILE